MLRFPRVDPRDSVTLCRERPTVVMELEGRAPAKFSLRGLTIMSRLLLLLLPSPPFVMLRVAYP